MVTSSSPMKEGVIHFNVKNTLKLLVGASAERKIRRKKRSIAEMFAGSGISWAKCPVFKANEGIQFKVDLISEICDATCHNQTNVGFCHVPQIHF